ncbi:MAG: alpha/beta hydrolase [Firmicutes bacterium]|nr:alpha/beta hydrolase [Bacillota bacterium]
MEKKKKGFLTLAALSSIPVLYYGSGSVIFNKLFKTNREYEDKDTLDMLPSEYAKDMYREHIVDDINWFKASKTEKIQIKSFDGLMLDGIKVINHETDKMIMMFHGYNTDRYALLRQAKIFADRGYNLLMVDQRGFGHSDGRYTTFGFKESLDVVSWMKRVVDENPQAVIGLYGVSLGASTVMKALGYKLYDNLKFAIADSGYSSLEDILKYRLKTDIINPAISVKVKKVLGFDVKEVDCVKALSLNETPLLIIHGEDDRIVPSSMAKELYDANSGYKKICILNTSDHAYGCYLEEFTKAIDEFLKDINQ